MCERVRDSVWLLVFTRTLSSLSFVISHTAVEASLRWFTHQLTRGALFDLKGCNISSGSWKHAMSCGRQASVTEMLCFSHFLSELQESFISLSECGMCDGCCMHVVLAASCWVAKKETILHSWLDKRIHKVQAQILTVGAFFFHQNTCPQAVTCLMFLPFDILRGRERMPGKPPLFQDIPTFSQWRDICVLSG